MEHGHALPKTDPGDFIAEEKKIKHAKPNYIAVFVVLGILTAIEIGITQVFPLSEEGIASVGRVPILLGLTIAKALLVILYYMHLKFDSAIYSIFFGSGVLALALPFVVALIFLLSPPHPESVRHGGENGGNGEPRPTAIPPGGPPISVTLEGGEFYFKADTLAAKPGQRVRVTLVNEGSVEHTFVVAKKPKSEDPEPWLTEDEKAMVRAAPDETGNGGFNAPGPGEWIFYCNVAGHGPAGMFGTLTVQ